MADSSNFSSLDLSNNTTPPSTTTTEIEPAAFERFDVLTNCSHHYFVKHPPKDTKSSKKDWSTDNNSTNKAIMREWKILAQDLPDTILVRAYEARLDLLTAVIIGAAGTPYHDGLFFFDIAFPPDYPFHPPQVRYRSYGFRINPNIYSNGHVCLSLLNTWHGQKKEKWNPKESSMLQVLLSIQALVLNSRPFFNEPDFGLFALMSINSWNRVSDKYNQEVFTMTCKAMHFVLQNPPPGFESVVHEHFRKRGCEILRAMEAYANGRVRVGFYGVEKGFESKFKSGLGLFVVSKRFQEDMKLYYARLLGDFRSRAGVFLGHIQQELMIQKSDGLGAKNKNGIVVRAFDKLKEVLGLKKKNGKSGGGD